MTDWLIDWLIDWLTESLTAQANQQFLVFSMQININYVIMDIELYNTYFLIKFNIKLVNIKDRDSAAYRL